MAIRKKDFSYVKNIELRTLLTAVDNFLDQHYAFRAPQYQGFWGGWKADSERYRAEREEKENSQEKYTGPTKIIFGSDPFVYQRAIDAMYARIKSHCFHDDLMEIILAKGLDPVVVYKRAGIDRRLYAKMKNIANYLPSKRTIIALALAMELSLEETNAFLGKAGYTLSSTILFDMIISYFITQREYNLDTINAVLYTYKQPILSGK